MSDEAKDLTFRMAIAVLWIAGLAGIALDLLK